ncbi:MAG: sugar ABC transporter permease [Armatimonadetes bacterium]|nr:sugar ABC transporter permease [Armatimonadota bacterium]
MKRDRLLAIWCLLPAGLLIGGVIFYPILTTFLTALSQVSRAGDREGWVGLAHFASLFRDPVFWQVLRQTLIWTASCVGITIACSLLIAVLLDADLPGRSLWRAVVLLPWAASLTISSVIWRWIFDGQFGMLNALLTGLHLAREGPVWLARPETSFPAIIGVGIWVSIPFTSIVLLAGLQSIPAQVYEAGLIDGAGAWTRFRLLTLPLLRPVLMVVTLLNIIYVFNSFPIIWTLTEGEPIHRTDTIITYLYKLAFKFQDYGPASALAILTFTLLLLFSALYIRLVYRQGLFEE